MSRRSRRLFVPVALILSLAACDANGTGSIFGVARMDDPLPRLAGRTLDDDPLDASTYADGNVLVVNVWAHDCAPCRREQPMLVELAHRYEADGVRFLGINYDDDLDSARAWVEEFDVPYPSLFDPAGRTAADLGYPAIPDTYVVDRGGTIRWAVFGEVEEQELVRMLDEVLS